MPIIGNKRVTQLVEITAPELAQNDLFLIIDSSARESKKIQISGLSQWLNGSASIIAFHALTADTASFIFGYNVFGIVDSSSFALNAMSSISSSFANNSNNSITSSYSLTSSFALNSSLLNSASYLIYSGFPNGTASYALKSTTSNTSATTQFLIYTGGNNGTASYSITTGTVVHADTASYFNNMSGSIASASWADNSGHSQLSDASTTTTFLEFSLNNGTASYALTAGGFANTIFNYGLFNADSQSASEANIDYMDILDLSGNPSKTIIESIFTIKIPFTASSFTPPDETLSLFVIDRNTGLITLMDTSSVVIDMGPIISNWGSYASGSITLPVSLMGQSNLYGSYAIYISGSSKITINSNRRARFNVDSVSNSVVYQDIHEPLQFTLDPSNTTLLYITSSLGSSIDFLSGLLLTGSSNILSLSFDNQVVTSVRYIWKLNNLNYLNCSSNTGLTFLSAMPSSLDHLNCSNCNLTSLFPLDNIVSMSYLNYSNNNLTSTPLLPASLSYLNCSDNLTLTTFPVDFPFGLTDFICDNTGISYIPAMPISLGTMSLASNLQLFQILNLPISLSYLSCENSPIGSLTSFPTLVGYNNLSSMSLKGCVLDESVINIIASDLYNNGTISGTLDVSNNLAPIINTTDIDNLITASGWTVIYDT